MAFSTNYIRWARRFSARYPALSFTAIQINYWIWANLLFVLLVYCCVRTATTVLQAHLQVDLLQIIMINVFLGIIYGACQGFAAFQIEKWLIAKRTLGRYLAFRLMAAILLSLLFLALFALIARHTGVGDPALNDSFLIRSVTDRYFLTAYIIYYIIMNILLIFINLVNSKYGPGVLLPLLFGRYTTPVEETRIFLFMDLRSSTMIAERLGHLRYSGFIRDAFLDINHMLSAHYAEVYQYVGDEIVVTWLADLLKAEELAVDFFFACGKRFDQREPYYMDTYGFVPGFKAALHVGKVTAVEVGHVKREIAYHGDTLNITARIQALCNNYGETLLASNSFAGMLVERKDLQIVQLGTVTLKGRTNETKIASITQN
jgi:adenylate cyclase